MVTIARALFLFLFFIFCSGLGQNLVDVSAEVDVNHAYENEPMQGNVSVTHSVTDQIDLKSFLLDNKPIHVDFVRQVKIAPPNPTVIDIYRFELPAQPGGLYMLPEVKVKVGGKEYSSFRSSYEVKKKSAGSQTPESEQIIVPQMPNKEQEEPFLKLEAGVNGSARLYPGQRTIVYYRFFYTGSVGLTLEKLPLLDAEGFLKIGEKEIKDYSKNQISVNEIKQEIEAVKPGDFSFGPSIVEGVAEENRSVKLHSEAPPVTITVLAFPDKDKPASFNGAVGTFGLFDVSLLGSSSANIGDEVNLQMKIKGSANLSSVPLPEIHSQPGISGFFRLSDLPAKKEVKDDQIIATIALRPLSTEVKEIPSLEFSFFNPISEKYAVFHSKPIPLTVTASPSKNLQEPNPPSTIPASSEKPVLKPSLIEIEGIYTLKDQDLHNRLFGTWWVLLIIPIGMVLIIYQMQLQHYFATHKKVQTEGSDQILQKAFVQPKESTRFFELLEQALKRSLLESHLIASDKIENENIPEEGVSGEVRLFLQQIDAFRFAKEGDMNDGLIRKRAKELIDKIRLAKQDKTIT